MNSSTVAAVEDRELAGALRTRDPRALAIVYDRYSNKLFDYCRGVLVSMPGGIDAAADVVHDTLLIAVERIGQLRDPTRLRPWLYAIARNECLRLLRGRRRLVDLAEAGHVTDENAYVDHSVRAREARELVQTAVSTLNSRERELLDLALRHDLDVAEISTALRVTPAHTHALLSRARAALERSIAVVVLSRTADKDCAQLAATLTDHGKTAASVLRKRASRHIDQCTICQGNRREWVRGAAMFAALPIAVLPLFWRSKFLEQAISPAAVSYRDHLATQAEPFDKAGFPVPLDRGRPAALTWLAAAVSAAVSIALLIGAIAALWIGPSGPGSTHFTKPRKAELAREQERGSGPTPAPPQPSASLTPSDVSPADPSRPSGRPNPSRVTSPSLPAGTGQRPRVTANASDTSVYPCGPWSGRVVVTVVGNTARQAVATWSDQLGRSREVILSSNGGGQWQGDLRNLPPGQVQWRVTVTTVDDLVGYSATQTISHVPCVT